MTEPTIVSADRTESGVVIIFSDGQSAFYSASLLFSVYYRALALSAPDEKDRDTGRTG